MTMYTLKKIAQWEDALHDAIDAKRFAPFQWGVNDCCLFAADVVLAMTQTDIADTVRGMYEHAAEACALVRAAGTVEDLATERLGLPMESLNFAQRGDVVSVEIVGRLSLGVCLGGDIAGPGEEGLVFLPFSNALHAWKVGA
jgi:hypothetical protein